MGKWANTQWITIYPSTHNWAPNTTRSVILVNTNLLTNNWNQLHIKHPDVTAKFDQTCAFLDVNVDANANANALSSGNQSWNSAYLLVYLDSADWLTFPAALQKHLWQFASTFCPSKVWPPWWTKSLSQHWPGACYWCSCLVVWEMTHLSLPSSHGIGLSDYSWWVPLVTSRCLYSLVTFLLNSYICWHRACV